MPELPEVETTLRGVEPYLSNAVISAVEVRDRRLRWPVSEQLLTLNNQQVRGLIRRGKYIIIQLDSAALLVHLGMSGSLRVLDAGLAPKKHDHVDIIMANGHIIRYNDPRRFGCVLWTESWEQHSLIRGLGPEPLGEDFTAKYLYQRAKGKKVSIKQYLMNGEVVVGVGNIYANEALFLAGISPKRAAGNISMVRIEALVEAIKTVLHAAIAQGGTTLKDFVNSDGSPGYFKQQLLVYGRGGMPCTRCQTSLKEVRQNQRTTVYCPCCQR